MEAEMEDSTLFFRDEVGNVVMIRRVGQILPLGVVIPGGMETNMRDDALLLGNDELPRGYDPIGPRECLDCFKSQRFIAALRSDGTIDLPTEGAVEDPYVEDA